VSHRGDLGDADDAQVEEMRRINVDGVVAVTAGSRRRHEAAPLRPHRERGVDRGAGDPHGRDDLLRRHQGRGGRADDRRFALELGPHGITVNAIAPGFV
jgi:3-oxoacyl-[acyl-carrier protein] reductase